MLVRHQIIHLKIMSLLEPLVLVSHLLPGCRPVRDEGVLGIRHVVPVAQRRLDLTIILLIRIHFILARRRRLYGVYCKVGLFLLCLFIHLSLEL